MIRMISHGDELDAALRLAEALVYKHSPACWQSGVARRHVQRFAEDHPEIPVLFLDVLARADLARELAAAVGIAHASPQVILLRDGRAVWSASHLGIRAKSLANAVRDAA